MIGAGIIIQVLLNLFFIVDLISSIIARYKLKKGSKHVKKLDYNKLIIYDIIALITTNLGFICGLIARL